MDKEFVKILVCSKCYDIIQDDEMVYQCDENGARYLCKCEDNQEYGLGLIVIGNQATCDCLEILDVD